MDEDMRMFSTDITIRVLGYLVGEGDNDDRPIVRIDENIVEVTYPSEEAIIPGDATFTVDSFKAQFGDETIDEEETKDTFDATDYIRSI